MNKKGVTLLELIVYMALAALVMVPIAMLMQNSSKNMARDSANTNLRMSGRDILNIMYDDLKNTGFKLNPNNFSAISGVMYNPPADTSSISPRDGKSSGRKFYDSLAVRMAKLNPANGQLEMDGTNPKIYEISYFVDGDKNLKRAEIGKTPLIIAENVEALQFQYSDDMTPTPSTPLDPSTAWVDPPFVGLSSGEVKYIKISILLKDNKRLAVARNRPDILVGKEPFPINDEALYELHSIVVPIPNNGLLP